MESDLWKYYRTIGYISDDVPVATEKRGSDFFIAVALGTNFNVYNREKLQLRFVSRNADSPIERIAMRGEVVVTAHAQHLVLWHRGRVSETIPITAPVVHIENMGTLFVVITADHRLVMYKLLGPKRGPHRLKAVTETLLVGATSSKARITSVLHPDGFLNKFLVGRSDGSVELWNVRTERLVHSFGTIAETLDDDSESAGVVAPALAVTSMAQAPAAGVVAIGFSSGQTAIVELHHALVLAVLRDANRSPVTALGFATSGRPVLASATDRGDITLWDLDEMRLSSHHPSVHDAGVRSLVWVPGEDLFISSASDNALRVWVVDSADGAARVLVTREGHSQPPKIARWFGEADRHLLLTAGSDDRTVRVFNSVVSRQSRQLSQGAGLSSRARSLGLKALDLRLLPASSLAANDLREGEFPTVATVHSGGVVFWDTERMALSKKVPGIGDASTVGVSACGKFALVAGAGRITTLVLQSGRVEKTSTVCRPDDALLIESDSMSHRIVVVWSRGLVQVLDLASLAVVAEHDLGAAVLVSRFHRASDLLAVVTDDMRCLVLDTVAVRVARIVCDALAAPAVGLSFAPNGRSLYVALPDAIVTADLEHGTAVDRLNLNVDDPVTSIDCSPDGIFLCTTHANCVGLRLWCSRVVFEGAAAYALPIEAAWSGADLEEARARAAEEEAEAQAAQMEKCMSGFDECGLPIPIKGEMAALCTGSGLPASVWGKLPKLDIIREKSKPTEAPKAPTQAPFFLTAAAGRNEPMAAEAGQPRPVLSIDTLGGCSTGAAVAACVSEEVSRALAIWTRLSPSVADREIRLLSALDGEEGCSSLGGFLAMVSFALRSKIAVDLACAWLVTVSKVHKEVLASDEELGKALSGAGEAADEIWNTLNDKFASALCLVDYAAKF